MSVRALARKRKVGAAGASSSPSSPSSRPAAMTDAAGAPVEATVRRLPAGDVAEAPREAVPVEPLTPHATGRDEAREAFVRDAGGVPSSPAGSPAESSGPGGAPRQESPPSSEPSSGAAVPKLSAEELARQGVVMLDGLATMLGPRFVGGSRDTWAMTPPEADSVAFAATPVIAKNLSAKLTIEQVLLGTLLVVYVPRTLLAIAEKADEDRRKAAEKRAAPTYEAPATVPATPTAGPVAVPPPPEKPAPVDDVKVSSLADYLAGRG